MATRRGSRVDETLDRLRGASDVIEDAAEIQVWGQHGGGELGGTLQGGDCLLVSFRSHQYDAQLRLRQRRERIELDGLPCMRESLGVVPGHETQVEGKPVVSRRVARTQLDRPT